MDEGEQWGAEGDKGEQWRVTDSLEDQWRPRESDIVNESKGEQERALLELPCVDQFPQ